MARCPWTSELDLPPSLQSGRSRVGLRLWRGSLLLLASVLLSGAAASAQVPLKKNVLILNEVGLSHPLTAMMTQQVVRELQKRSDRNVEFYSESLDLMSFQGKLTP